MIRAVLFDMDGALLDTRRIYRECWRYAAKKTNFQGSIDEDIPAFFGLNRTDIVAYFKNKYGEDFNPMPMLELRHSCEPSIARQQGDAGLKPDVLGALTQLRTNGIRLAVTTFTELERTESYLTHVGILDKFDACITGEALSYSKPHPEIFWLAADALECAPDECVVVEDSPSGIRAGYAAGMHTVMISDTQSPVDEIRPLLWHCIDSVASLPQLISEENKN